VIKNEEVINTVIWDGVSDWAAPEETTVELAPENVGIGWTRVDGVWTQPAPDPISEEQQNKINARAKLLSLGLSQDEVEALIK